MNDFKKFIASLLAKGFATTDEKVKAKDLFSALKSEEQDDEAKEELEEVEKLPEEEDEEGNAIDAKTLQAVIAKSISDATQGVAEKAYENISKEITQKFFAGVGDNRKVATKAVVEEKGQFTESIGFFKKLFAGETASLKAAGYLDTGTTGTMGFLVPPAEFIAEVYRIADVGYGIARQEMRYIPKNGAGNTMSLPALSSSVTATWTDEAEVKTSTQPTFILPQITLKKLAAIVPWTDESMEDVGIPVIQLLASLFAEALARKEDEAFFNGDGTGTYGDFTGILNLTGTNEVVITGDDFDEVVADDFLRMQDATPEGAQAGAKYYMNRSILSVVRTLKATDGHYIYQEPGGSQVATLWNKPVVLVEAMPGTEDTDEDKAFAIYGNLRNTCVITDKGNLAMKIFDAGSVRNVGNSSDLNLITQDMQAMRVVRRVGYQCILPAGLTVLKTAESGS